MWPGQQPPGGEQNPQDPNTNPYQQPGYQQPNPYQQPGYQQQPGYPQQQPGYPQQPGAQQPNPYQQPTAPQYAAPGQPTVGLGGPGGPDPSQDKKRTKTVAIIAASAVVVAAAATGFFVLNDDGESKNVADDPKASASKEPKTKPSANPRDGSGGAEPTIAGWKVVTNPSHGTRFDVPADWVVEKPGTYSGFEDVEKGDGSPAISFSAPAFLKSNWCEQDTDQDGTVEDVSLGGAGTKGGKGAKDTATAASNESGSWVWAAYAQEATKDQQKKAIEVKKSKAYTTKSGLKGHYSTAASTGLPKKQKCDSDGKSIAFTFTDSQGDYKTWVLYGARGVDDEIPDATLLKIMSTVRLAE